MIVCGTRFRCRRSDWSRATATTDCHRRFPTDEAAIKLLWLALQKLHGHTIRSAKAWHQAMNQFAIVYGDHFTTRAA
jgi:transposase-like protein